MAAFSGRISVINPSVDRAPMPTLFSAEGTPQETFPSGLTPWQPNVTGRYYRFIHKDDLGKRLIYTDGACLDNGQANPRAGSAFVFHKEPGHQGYVAFRLENEGPSGEPHPQTSNRAELRAVLAALQFRYWPGEGVKTLVLATDSEYVAFGCTDWVHNWEQNNWNTARGPVKNKDLWMALLNEFRSWSQKGLKIEFWRIARELNGEADYWARVGASEDEKPSFTEIVGTLC